jgi:TonB-linked SusC/RagA family outer membrane protein
LSLFFVYFNKYSFFLYKLIYFMRKLTFLLLVCFCVSATLFAQKQVTGKVTDAKNKTPLPDVSVKVKGSSTGTVTAADGSYSITLPTGVTTLVFSSIGFGDQEVEVTGNNASVSLTQASATSLSEVVVVGFGTNTKRNLTGSIARIKGADIEHMPVPDLNQAMQGRAAGVFVESQNGKVGDDIKVRIRGAASINGSNQPLYVVDGIPVVGSLYGSGTADINFDDIESFEILKDASATAIYGSRASNGVVLLTSKRGKAGKTKLTLNTQYGWNSPTNDNRGFLNSAEFIEYFTAAATNAAKYNYNRAGNPYGYADEQEAIDEVVGFVEGRFTRYSGGKDWRKLEVDNNWEKQAFQKANTNQTELSAQGGNDKTKFYASGFYNDQDGILVGNRFKRLGGRINVDNEVNKWLKVGVNLALTKITRNRVPEDNQFSTPMQIVALAPITPTRNDAGLLNNTPVTTYYNPLLDYEEAKWQLDAFRNQGKAFADIRLMQGLTLHSEFGFDVTNQNEDRYWGPRTQGGNISPTVKGASRNQWFRSSRWVTNNFLNYNANFSGKHKLDATIGTSFESVSEVYSYVEGQGFPDDALRTLASASEITSGSGTTNKDNLISYFGRINYAFDGKFLFSVSARADGSARFGKSNKYGYFPAGSLGWVVTEHEFMEGTSKWLSFLKPKVSYGITGNNSIGLYSANAQYNPTTYATVAGLSLSNPGNEALKWETARQLDIGVEFGLFNNRLTGEFDYYVKKTKDLLYSRPVTSISGVTSLLSNIGEMENKGVEIVLNSTNVSTRNFRWTTSLNIAKNKNKVLKLDGDQSIIRGDARFANALVVGQPIGIFYGVKYAGVDVQNGDALFYMADGKTTTDDYNAAGTDFIIGDPNPDWMGGLTNTVSYKGLDFSFLFQGVFGNQVQNGAGGFMSARGDWFDNQTRDQLNGWKKPGDVTNIPEARLNYYGDFASPSISSQYVEDASYVRLKSVMLSYNLPSSVMAKLKMSSAKFYVSGINLLTFTKYSGWDPEVNTDYRSGNVNQGSDFYAAPQIKSIVVGLNLGF